ERVLRTLPGLAAACRDALLEILRIEAEGVAEELDKIVLARVVVRVGLHGPSVPWCRARIRYRDPRPGPRRAAGRRDRSPAPVGQVRGPAPAREPSAAA